jgi:hypothetical protein
MLLFLERCGDVVLGQVVVVASCCLPLNRVPPWERDHDGKARDPLPVPNMRELRLALSVLICLDARWQLIPGISQVNSIFVQSDRSQSLRT